MKSSQPLLEVAGLQLAIGAGSNAIRPVDGVDFRLDAGETLALLGESGCGKSMTALGLMRLLPPGGRILAGSVRLAGVDLPLLTEQQMRAERGGRLGMIFQEPMTSLNPVMSIGEQIAEAVRLHDADQAGESDSRVIELLQSVGIPDPARRAAEYPHQLSGGMKQRVMIAIALAGRPKLLIADEPTTALDVTIQLQVLSLLKDLQRQTGMAVLLITHDLGVVAEMADRVAVMYAGQIVEQARVADFFAHPAHPYSQKLFQSLPGRLKRGQELAVIRGQVPSLRQSFSGCRFAERCDQVQPLCREQAPGWQELAEQQVRCHLAGQLNEQTAAASPANTATQPADAASSGEPLLQVQGLKVHFPIRKGLLRRAVAQVRAVDGVDLQLATGRTLALVGESGCGKTTVGKAILQLIRPTAGQISFRGQRLDGLSARGIKPYRADMQIIFQDPYASMNPRMRVLDILAEGLRAQGRAGAPAALRQRLAELLQQVGLSAEALERYPHEFSGGQRQRIAIARALALEPRLLICDEPTSALDVSVQAQILNLLKQLQQRLGLGYLFISHNIAVVAYLAHDLAVMYLGRIVEQGPVQQLLQQPRHPYTRALLEAAPVLEVGKRHQAQLQGDMPSPAAPPPGCHFHPRCPKADERCRQSYPPEQQEGERRFSCFYPE
ncbi:ABC transporter ATP-binding protein [Magnetovirga frankeli]|uniref:ABC transporter ATP-binding protein n=1 Tax=Magnetovirga frankeli TaxID=947516 RepID=UPI0012940E8D|nr:ABC transporter ATP-binding protein [gamma proteobacterium SS-5]